MYLINVQHFSLKTYYVCPKNLFSISLQHKMLVLIAFVLKLIRKLTYVSQEYFIRFFRYLFLSEIKVYFECTCIFMVECYLNFYLHNLHNCIDSRPWPKKCFSEIRCNSISMSQRKALRPTWCRVRYLINKQ